MKIKSRANDLPSFRKEALEERSMKEKEERSRLSLFSRQRRRDIYLNSFSVVVLLLSLPPEKEQKLPGALCLPDSLTPRLNSFSAVVYIHFSATETQIKRRRSLA